MHFLWGTVIPFFMFLPYVRLYIASRPAGYHEWPLNAEKEVERVLELSRITLAFGIFPLASTLLSLRTVKIMLCEISMARLWASVAPAAGLLGRAPTGDQLKNKFHGVVTHKLKRWLGRWVHRLLVLYGLAVLTISICASGIMVHDYSGQYPCSHRIYS